MKRISAFLFAALLCALLAACGGKTPAGDGEPSSGTPGASQQGATQAAEFENKIDLLIDKSHYDQAERIEVTMDLGDVDQESAVIVIVRSDMAHGGLAPAEENTEEYRWLADFSEIPFYLWAPEKDGVFDARVYAGADGEELASVSFAVGGAQLAQTALPPTEPPKDGGSVKQAHFDPPKAIYMDVRVGGSTAGEGGTYSFALLDGNYSYTVSPDGIFFHDSAETKTQYCRYGDGWRIDNSANEGGRIPEEELTYEMTEYLDTFYSDAEHGGYSGNIAKYYVGTETVCHRSCYVYELKDDGFGVYKKFWVDPENGATLKYVECAGGEGSGITYEFEVTQYNLLGPVWSSAMRPDYGSVTETLY